MTAWAVIAAIVVVSLFLNLRAADFLLVPSYFDSAEHVRLVNILMDGVPPVDVASTTPTGYYHLGFHLLTAALAGFWHVPVPQMMLTLGALMLVAIPLSVFFLARRFTEGNAPALFVALLASWGWSMPAYALNWGKYPLVAAMVTLPLALGFGVLAARATDVRLRFWRLVLFVVFALLSVLFHTRMLIVIGVATVAWLISRTEGRTRLTVFALTMVALIGLVFVIENQDLLRPAFDPYIHHQWFISALVVLLLPFAIKKHPQFALFTLLLMAGLLACLFIPAGFPASQTLLDRPFVQTVLSLPLALLGGLGFDCVVSFFGRRWLAGALFALVLANAAWSYDPRPACCVIYNAPDAVAFDWMDANLPADARILTAAAELRVLVDNPAPGLAGSDAGVWIPALIRRGVFSLPNDTDLADPAVLGELCANGVDHIYIGSVGQSFDRARIESQPGWYALDFSMPPVYLYRVTGCE